MGVPIGLAGGRVPQPHRAVAVGAGQQLAVRAERHPDTPPPVWPVGGVRRSPAGGRVPQPHRAIAAGGGQQLAVRAERHRRTRRRCRWPWRGSPTGWPVAGFHNRTVPSPPAVASSLPSGLNATPITPLGAGRSWRGVPTGWPVAGSHNRTVPSPPALASSLPSGLNATPNTPPAGRRPWRGVPIGLAGGRVPQPHRAIAAGAGQQLAVRAERHPEHAMVGVAGWRGVPMGWPVAGSHNRTVPSPPALASSLPSGLNATANTPLGAGRPGGACRSGWPVAGSHSRTVPSPPALASSLPSGLNATPFTPPWDVAGQEGADLPGRWPGPTAAPCRHRRRWPGACRPG